MDFLKQSTVRNGVNGLEKREQCGAVFKIQRQEVVESERRRLGGNKQEVWARRGESCQARSQNPVSKRSRDFFCPNVFSKAKHGSNVSGSLAEILVQNESVRKTKKPVCNGGLGELQTGRKGYITSAD